MKNIGVIVGKFQVAEVSQSLKDFITSIEKQNDAIAIVLAESKVRGKVNPFSANIRELVLKEQFSAAKIYVLNDHPSNEQWSADLDEIAESNFPKHNITFYGSSDGFVPFYSGKFKVYPCGKSVNEKIDVKEIEQSFRESFEFRKGIQYALHSSFDKVFPTVDIALFRGNRAELLLGFKDLDKKWRLMGGFADPDDSSYEEAVQRELKEEAGIEEVSNLAFEGSFKIDDWRYRRERDKIITCLYSADLISGDALGSDDIAEVKWFPLSAVNTLLERNEVAPEHIPLFKFLLMKYLK